jgi:predicted RNase H-like nuclease
MAVSEALRRTRESAGASNGSNVVETYPVLAIISLLWTLPHTRVAGRLPKYNPARRTTFSISDWHHICDLVSCALKSRGLTILCHWTADIRSKLSPTKRDQDCLDAWLCLLVALHLVERKLCLMIGNLQTGYMVVPHGDDLFLELTARCTQTGKIQPEWLRRFTLTTNAWVRQSANAGSKRRIVASGREDVAP